jgi:hypothetical protein
MLDVLDSGQSFLALGLPLAVLLGIAQASTG